MCRGLHRIVSELKSQNKVYQQLKGKGPTFLVKVVAGVITLLLRKLMTQSPQATRQPISTESQTRKHGKK